MLDRSWSSISSIRVGDPRIADTLERHLLGDPDSAVRARICLELGLYRREAFANPFLQSVREDTSAKVQAAAMNALSRMFGKLSMAQKETLFENARVLYDHESRAVRLEARMLATQRLDRWLEAARSEELKGKVAVEELLPALLEQGRRIQPFLCDIGELLHEVLGEDKRALLEGQLGALRDPDHDIYPFSTSSHPLAGFATVGAVVPPYLITDIVAVAKAYSSCVGAGPFVTELDGEAAQRLRNRGGDAGEYGATTGRPRRVGWFDAVTTRYGCRVQGATEIALTALNMLGYLKEIPLCVDYEIDEVRAGRFPVPARLAAAAPVYETLPGWLTDISVARSYDQLPDTARMYVERMEELVVVPVTMISVGPQRDAIIRRFRDGYAHGDDIY